MLKKLLKKDMTIGITAGIISTLLVTWFIQLITNWFFPKMINILTFLNASFSDFIYREIPYATTTRSNESALLFSFTTAYIFLLLLFFLTYSLAKVYKILSIDTDTSSSKDEIVFTEKKNPIISFIKLHNEIFFQISYALFAFLIIFCVFITCKDLYIKEKASDLTINMEIISPLLSDQDYKQLRANFYSIDSKKDYDDFTNHLEAIANENNITLRK